VDSVTNQRFEIIGIAYQPGGSAGYGTGKGDPLSNPTACLRDATIMQKLGTNTIRVYNVDPTVNHDQCASIFNDAGIYMILDVNSPLPNESIDAGAPWTSYDSVYLTRIFSVVEAFKNYPNTLGFFSANEVINDDNSGTLDPPYIRAVTRDLKNYIAKHCDRPIPVGYSAADVRPILLDTYNYVSCSEKTGDMSRSDFFGLNSYSWCGADATFHSSTYDTLTADFANATIPVFFSEYGCIKPARPRSFNEVQAIYGAEMRAVMSGGLVYQWTQDSNNYGLVQVNDNGTAQFMDDFANFQGQLNKLDITAITAMNSTATSITAPSCSSSLISGSFDSNFTIPAVPPGGQTLIDNGISNPNNGKLVTITNTTCPFAVYDYNMNQITGLQLNILSNDGTNAPSGTNLTGSSTGTSSTSSSSPSASKNAGLQTEAGASGVLTLFGVLAMWFL